MAWSDRRLIEYEPELGRATYFRFNAEDMRFGVEEVWDTAPITAATKALFNQTDERAPWKGDWHHVASIPLPVLEEHKRQTGIDLLRYENRSALKRFLNDSANRAFRIRPGRV